MNSIDKIIFRYIRKTKFVSYNLITFFLIIKHSFPQNFIVQIRYAYINLTTSNLMFHEM